MFLGKLYRKKRALLLPSLPASKKKPPPAMSQWVPPVHNINGRCHQWYEGCYRTHAAFCGCGNFINHLIALGDQYGFRPGPRAPGRPGSRRTPGPAPSSPAGTPGSRSLPSRLTTTTTRDWPGDGGADAGEGGSAASGGGEQLPEDDLDGLLAALDDEE